MVIVDEQKRIYLSFNFKPIGVSPCLPD